MIVKGAGSLLNRKGKIMEDKSIDNTPHVPYYADICRDFTQATGPPSTREDYEELFKDTDVWEYPEIED